jgi:hypothetical protein
MFVNKVALHVEAALRLRTRPGSLVAVLTRSGRVVHADEAFRARTQLASLAEHVERIEHARGRTGDASQLDMWSALLDGRYGFLGHQERDMPAFYYVLTAAQRAGGSLLSPLQSRLLELSCRGLSGKMVAYALEVSQARVSESLREAALRVGGASGRSLCA